MDIEYFHRKNKSLEKEKVYGVEFINWLYKNPIGNLFSNIATGKKFSELFGLIQSTPFSRHKIDDFIKQYNINIDEFLPQPGRGKHFSYETFNDFFIRRFKKGARVFPTNLDEMGAFIEGRYFGFNKVDSDQLIPVKGKYLLPEMLIGDKKWSSLFEGGPLVIGRLAPVDYHRFHFPFDGEILDSNSINGDYHSVNPVALKEKGDIFAKNIRKVTVLHNKEFGHLAYIEVGATCVGKIVQSYSKKKFQMGDEKGYFLFGGSTVIILGEPKRWKISDDICSNSSKGIETYIQLGDVIGSI